MELYMFKTICIGDSNTGKTHFIQSINKRLNNQPFEHNDSGYVRLSEHGKHSDTFCVSPTLGMDFFSKIFRYNSNYVKLHFWDLSGLSRFSETIKYYLNIGECVIYFFDVHDSYTFRSITQWMQRIDSALKVKQKNNDELDIYTYKDNTHTFRHYEDDQYVKDHRYKLLIGNVRTGHRRDVEYKDAYIFAKEHGMEYIEFNDTKEDTFTICNKLVHSLIERSLLQYTDSYKNSLYSKQPMCIDYHDIQLLKDDESSECSTVFSNQSTSVSSISGYGRRSNKPIYKNTKYDSFIFKNCIQNAFYSCYHALCQSEYGENIAPLSYLDAYDISIMD